MADTKRCTICSKMKPAEDFHLVSSRGRQYRQGRCKACSVPYLAAWRSGQSPEQRSAKLARDRRLQLEAKYGITRDEYARLLEAQGGVCAICEQTDASGRHLSVDHDHDTDVVRGLLCHCCNVAIGLMREDVDVLAKAIRYLSTAKERTA